MTVRDLIIKLLETRDMERQVKIDAAGRGTFYIADVDGTEAFSTTVFLVTEYKPVSNESVHTDEEARQEYASRND